MFHAKKIFFDNSLEYIKYDYGNFFFNSYPILGPTLAASLGKIVGQWNYLYPKFSILIISIPSIIFLYSLIHEKINKILFLFIITLILERRLIIGEMDAAISLYFVSSIFILIKILDIQKDLKKRLQKNNINKNYLYFLIFLNLSFMLLLKKEGLVYFVIIFISLTVMTFINNELFNKSYKKLFIFFACAFLNYVIWKLYIDYIPINNINFHPAVTNIFNLDFIEIIKKIFNIKNFLLISGSIYINKFSLITLTLCIFLISSYVLPNKKYIKINKNIFLFLFFIILIYLIFIYTVYQLTSWEINFHLSSSADRLMMPLYLLICFSSIYFSEKSRVVKNYSKKA